MVTTANVDHVVRAARDDMFRRAYDWAWSTTADGWPVQVYARLRGAPIGRVTGADLFARLMARFDPKRHRLFFVLSNHTLGDRLEKWLQNRNFTPDAIEIEVPKFGFEKDATAASILAQRVRNHRTTHLILGVGAPKSEIWSFTHKDAIGGAYILCVGASAEFFTGMKRRAPVVVQRCGFEWLWRFAQEPQRLFSRYFIDSWPFLSIVGKDVLRHCFWDRRKA